MSERGLAETTAAHRRLFAQAGAFIAGHYGDPELSLAGLARELYVSDRQLQRIFRTVSGTTFSEHVERVRLERAVDLLSRSVDPLPVRVVAQHVGYRGVSGLRQAFARRYGFPPSTIQPAPGEHRQL